MKVLWFTNTASRYKKASTGYNGGGWISALEQIVSEQNNIELAVSFYHTDRCFKSKQENVTYYPISLYTTKWSKLKRIISSNKNNTTEIAEYLKIIHDFKPDVIHVFGSENSFGLLTKHTNIPVIIHIQGLLNPCLNAYYAPGSSRLDYNYQFLSNPFKLVNALLGQFNLNKNTKREVQILKECNFFMGRTAWDKNISTLYATESKYFYCSEMLRDIFYEANPWANKNHETLVLVSTLSKTSYKGFDLVLKTAKLLKTLAPNLIFEWLVFGLSDYKEWEKKLKIKCEDVSVSLKGIASSETLVKNIQKASIFIHPSYIDNSPNSVCEAQILGIPVISTNVGGTSSLITDNETGFLIPSNDPYTLASKIMGLNNNPVLAAEIGSIARKTALLRHDKETIKTDLFHIYNTLYDAKSNH